MNTVITLRLLKDIHHGNFIVSAIASQIIGLSTVYWTICSGAEQRKQQSSASLAFVRVNSPHKGPVTRKMFPFDDVIMNFTKNSSRSPRSHSFPSCDPVMIQTGFPNQLRHTVAKTIRFIVSHTSKLWQKTKWPLLYRRNFAVYFLAWKLMYSNSNFTYICF